MTRQPLLGALILGLCLTLSTGLQARELRVGVYHNPPKLLLDEQQQLSGIFGDLLRAIAAQEQWTLVPVPCTWQHCLNLLGNGELDIMPDVAFSEDRAQTMDFHQVPTLYSWSQLYQSGRHDINAFLDLDGKRVAVLEGSIQHHHLIQKAENFGINPIWLPTSSLEQGFELVAQEHADVVAANHFYGDKHALRAGLRATPIMFQPAQLFFASTGGRQDEVLSRIDQYLREWKANDPSPFFEIMREWGAIPAVDAHALAVSPQFWWTVGILALLLLLALSLNFLLRRQVEEKTRHIKASEERLNTILDSVEACIYIKDRKLRYQYANQKLCNLLGLSREDIIGRTDADFFDAKATEHIRDNDHKVIKDGIKLVDEEVTTFTTLGTPHTFLSAKLPLYGPDDRIYALCGISTDITELRQIQEQMHQLAYYDPLTSLPNRRLLIDRLSHALANHKRTGLEGALIFIDMDNFKVLNDSLGMDYGDLLLCQVSERLNQHVRATDTLARLSADEFALLVESLPDDAEASHQLRRLGQKLLERLSQPFALNDSHHVTSASLGIVMLSEASGSADELLKRADLAVNEAKSSGRNTMRFFNPTMQAEVSRRARLEADLRYALSQQQLRLHIQPQVDQHGSQVGMEALVRWEHPQDGIIAPSDFIPVAESSGLIIPLGEWLVSQACQMLAQWSSHPRLRHLTLAINISPRQFRHPKFVNHVLNSLRVSGINPAHLKLEITESLLIEDLESIIKKMKGLKDLGLRFSLDDFGTGYASLSYLKRLPLDQIKIDQSFVRDLLTDKSDEAIIRTIVALGESLEIEIIAEGVENEAQLARLKQLGCRLFQGYLFGRPAPISHWAAETASSVPQGR
ncbi:EAL domain-containing protein [Pseudomonas jilinensis]|uniref:cyclic-guanylate-specific phosphodiesterase n=1 Tax=Pseudomonas jilinensis TaxID=2078689 RepID=A0A396S4K7_9PSED|nr:EAL domain-containing protein [Pseudomonas jilinensis]RHW22633.1 diguanylate cyclase [Pseudomonas jilinensis]